MPKRLEELPEAVGGSPKGKRMSMQSEARALLWEAVPQEIGDNRKSWLHRAARLLNWSPRRVRAIWHCEARTITAEEWLTLQRRLSALKSAQQRHKDTSHELREVYRAARADGPAAGRTADRLGD